MAEIIELPAAGGTGTPSAHLFSGTGGAGLGLLVVPDDDGLTPHIRDVCDRLVAEGFTALALEAPEPPEIAAGAIDRLSTHHAVRGDGVGVIGFGRGGGLALRVASLCPDQIRAVVPFYGLPPPESQLDLARLDASVEGHFAEDDETVAPGAIEALERRLDDLDKDVRMFTYSGAAHGFFDDTRSDVYDAEAARQAWVRTLEFLRAKLG